MGGSYKNDRHAGMSPWAASWPFSRVQHWHKLLSDDLLKASLQWNQPLYRTFPYSRYWILIDHEMSSRVIIVFSRLPMLNSSIKRVWTSYGLRHCRPHHNQPPGPIPVWWHHGGKNVIMVLSLVSSDLNPVSQSLTAPHSRQDLITSALPLCSLFSSFALYRSDSAPLCLPRSFSLFFHTGILETFFLLSLTGETDEKQISDLIWAPL